MENNSVERLRYGTHSGRVSAYARDGVELMRKSGVICGDPSGNFLPKDKATRAQAAAIFVRLMDVLNNAGQ